MVSSDVRITGAVARQTDQTVLSTGSFEITTAFLSWQVLGYADKLIVIIMGKKFVFKTCLASGAKV